MAVVAFNCELCSAIYIESNTLVKGFYMNDHLEHNVYKPINISHPSYLVSFASYFCGSTGFSNFILIKVPGA